VAHARIDDEHIPSLDREGVLAQEMAAAPRHDQHQFGERVVVQVHPSLHLLAADRQEVGQVVYVAQSSHGERSLVVSPVIPSRNL